MHPNAPRKGGGVDPVLSIFADGTDGFYLDYSKTDRLFQDLTGTPADGAGENIYLGLDSHSWGGKTFAQVLAAQPERVTNGDFATGSLSGWTVANNNGTNTIVYDDGGALFTFDGTTVLNLSQTSKFEVGKTYLVEFDASDVTGVGLKVQSGSDSNIAVVTADGHYSRLHTADGTALFVYRRSASAGGGRVSNISVKEIPGNHGLQATTSAQPKLQTGGLARFDGSDDNLSTPLSPAASFSMLFKGKITSASKVVLGSVAGAGTNAYLGVKANGKLGAGVGRDGYSLITGGSDIRGSTGVGAVTWNGTVANLYWNASVIVSAWPQNGSPTTTMPVRVGALNNNGTASNFADADIYHALAIKKALTAAQIAAITNKWGTS